jgi:hypothetical protein
MNDFHGIYILNLTPWKAKNCVAVDGSVIGNKFHVGDEQVNIRTNQMCQIKSLGIGMVQGGNGKIIAALTQLGSWMIAPLSAGFQTGDSPNFQSNHNPYRTGEARGFGVQRVS